MCTLHKGVLQRLVRTSVFLCSSSLCVGRLHVLVCPFRCDLAHLRYTATHRTSVSVQLSLVFCRANSYVSQPTQRWCAVVGVFICPVRRLVVQCQCARLAVSSSLVFRSRYFFCLFVLFCAQFLLTSFYTCSSTVCSNCCSPLLPAQLCDANSCVSEHTPRRLAAITVDICTVSPLMFPLVARAFLAWILVCATVGIFLFGGRMLARSGSTVPRKSPGMSDPDEHFTKGKFYTWWSS